MDHEAKRILSRKNIVQLWITLIVFSIVTFGAYSFKLFGLRAYIGDRILPWVLMTVLGAVAVWLFNIYSLNFTAWVLGRSDEVR